MVSIHLGNVSLVCTHSVHVSGFVMLSLEAFNLPSLWYISLPVCLQGMVLYSLSPCRKNAHTLSPYLSSQLLTKPFPRPGLVYTSDFRGN